MLLLTLTKQFTQTMLLSTHKNTFKNLHFHSRRYFRKYRKLIISIRFNIQSNNCLIFVVSLSLCYISLRVVRITSRRWVNSTKNDNQICSNSKWKDSIKSKITCRASMISTMNGKEHNRKRKGRTNNNKYFNTYFQVIKIDKKFMKSIKWVWNSKIAIFLKAYYFWIFMSTYLK